MNPPRWKLDQEISFKNVIDYLRIAKSGVEKAIDQQKDLLRQHTSMRDRFRKP